VSLTPEVRASRLRSLRSFRGYTADEAELAAWAADEVEKLEELLEQAEVDTERKVTAEIREQLDMRDNEIERLKRELSAEQTRGIDRATYEMVVEERDRLEAIVRLREQSQIPMIPRAAHAKLQRLEAEVEKLEGLLRRAAYVAEHLMGMIPLEQWRRHGGDDMQGHYEGDYHAEKVAEEIRGWKNFVDSKAK
jgi:hypothetical protein